LLTQDGQLNQLRDEGSASDLVRAAPARPLLLVPIPPLPHYALSFPPLRAFVAGIPGVGVLAGWIRTATEQLAQHTGPAVGSLLTISLGSRAESS
jgi:Ca2+/H+ antiporter